MKTKKGLLLLTIATALLFLAACRGEPAPTPTTASAIEKAQPTPDKPTATPLAQVTPDGRDATDSPGTFPLPMTPIRPAQSPAATVPAPTQAPPTMTTTPTPTGLSEESTLETEDIETVRAIVAAYWKSLNDYDVDHAITMLEPAYRAAEEELIRKDIGRMKLFRVKLDVSEETPPTLNENGDYETYLSMKTPVDTRRVLMVLRQIDGAWWIVSSGEVE